MSDLIFVTGNQSKADYLAKLLDHPVDHAKLELDEIQSTDLNAIVEHKVRQAYELVRSPVLVEDVALAFTAWDGLPGPFIKFFVETADQMERLCRMLDAFPDRSARGVCTFGYYDGQEVRLFQGAIEGIIADHPRGDGGYGWDKIFCPLGYDGKTRAELSAADYDTVYRQIRPFETLKKFLTTL